MKLSLSGRIAEDADIKDRNALDFATLVHLASQTGYLALCIRPSQVTAQTPPALIHAMRQTLDNYGLRASMLTPDTNIAANQENAADALRYFDRALAMAERLGADLIRIGLKTADDVTQVQSAADRARERGIRLAHQTHTASPFETVDDCLAMVARINRPNFGLIVEPANLLLCQEDYGPDALHRLAPHIFNVYVQNLRLDPNGSEQIQTNRGLVHYERLQLDQEGGIDFARFFAGLKQIGYTGYVTSHQPALGGLETDMLAQRIYNYLTQFEGR